MAGKGMLGAIAGLFLSTQALAQGVMEKLTDFNIVEAANLEAPSVPQGGRKASAISEMLKRIELPKGFKIDLYAIVPDARHMAVGPNLGVLFVGTRKTKVWAVTDRDRDHIADEVKEFAPGIKKKFPNGVAFDKQGFLYLAEHNRVLVFPAAESSYGGPDVAVGVVKDRFVPAGDEYFNHAFRVIGVGPDDKLYVAIGQPYNVWPRNRPFQDPMGSIVRMNKDGSNYEVFARGIRNSVGLDFNPKTGQLWFTDNQVDGMGDDIPPGELNRAPEIGMSFGFPWYGGGRTRTAEWADTEPPAGEVFPEIEFPAHAADLGMTFYTGNQFPASYMNDLFVAEHGSWNRTTPVGAQILRVKMDEDGNAVSYEVFAKGWLDEKTGEYHGRPVDVVQMLDGSLLVSDDRVGAVYRISYTGE